MMLSPGWGHIVQLWNIQREQIIKAGKTANQMGNKDVTMVHVATLDGFDKAIAVADALKRRYEEMQEDETNAEKERQEAVLEGNR